MFTTFVLNAEGQMLYTYENSEDLEAAIQAGKSTLSNIEEAQYAFIIENVVTRHKQTVAFNVQYKWFKAKSQENTMTIGYETTANTIVERIAALIPIHPRILYLKSSWGLFSVPGFQSICDDLRPSLAQASWAFNTIRKDFLSENQNRRP